MTVLRLSRRVRLAQTFDGVPLRAEGIVVRISADSRSGWVSLPERSSVRGVHPFPLNDMRARWVQVRAEDCEVVR